MNKAVELEINRSIFDRENWKAALNGMTQYCESLHTHIVVFDKAAQLVDAFVSTLPQHKSPETDGGIQEYLKFKDQDIRIPNALSKLKVGESLNHHDLFENNELRESTIYQEYFSKHKAEHQALSRIYGPHDSIVLMAIIRGEERGHYNDGELQSIRSLIPLIQNTLHSQFKLEQYELFHQSIESLLEQEKIGVFYLDENLEILETSTLAQTFLNRKDGLIDRFKKLAALDHRDNDRLQKFLNLDYSKPHYSSIFIKRSIYETPYKLTASPILDKDIRFSMKSPSMMLLVSEPKEFKNFPAQLFKDHYGLTNSELLLAQAVFNDVSLNEYASIKEVKISTVRWTLKNIFSKTDTHAQKELKSLALVFS